MNKTQLGPIIFSFFEDYLKHQKGLRLLSIKSYRDTIQLFLHYISQISRCKITRLCISDLKAQHVVSFLKFLEDKRNNNVHTRNQRLAALRTFFEYLGYRLPEALQEAERVAAIPTKRTSPSETYFLERDEIELIFSHLPSQGKHALRDRTLLTLLYNTGARVQEIAELKVANLELIENPRIHLHGKGDKWRVCPLWKKTASLLLQLLHDENIEDKSKSPVFQSQKGQALTRYGIYKIVRKYTKHILKKKTDASVLKISPHTFRHTTAVHLLEAGVELNVIRGWLGPVSLETTNRYAEINLRMKEAAMKMCDPPLNLNEGFPRKPMWRDDSSLLDWLQSL
jgi:integrase/recombinase XerD